MKKTSLLFSIIALFILIPLGVSAFEVKTDNAIYINEDEIIEGNLYAIGNTITIDGTIKGDIFCGGQTININGLVEGDVICIGQTLNLNGPINGSARVAGNSILINNSIAKGVQAIGVNINLSKDANVGWDMFLAGGTGELRGKIGGDLHGAVANATIAGEIGGDVKLRLDEKRAPQAADDFTSLTVSESAIIGGNLYYSAGQEGIIAEKASIGGEVGFSESKKKSSGNLALAQAWAALYSIFAALVVGLVLITIWREPIKNICDKMLKNTAVSIGWGAAIMFLVPIVAFLLLITIIGIPLALILIAVWLIAIYVSKIIVGILIGRSIMNRLLPKRKDSLIWAMIIGVTVLWFFTSIPIIGWLLSLVVIWWGLGGIWQNFKKA